MKFRVKTPAELEPPSWIRNRLVPSVLLWGKGKEAPCPSFIIISWELCPHILICKWPTSRCHLIKSSFQPSTFRGETQTLLYISNQAHLEKFFFLCLCCCWVKFVLLIFVLKKTQPVLHLHLIMNTWVWSQNNIYVWEEVNWQKSEWFTQVNFSILTVQDFFFKLCFWIAKWDITFKCQCIIKCRFVFESEMRSVWWKWVFAVVFHS